MGKVKGGTNGNLSRKELRKAHRQAAKEKKQQRHNLKQNVSAGAAPSGPVAAAAAASSLRSKSGKGKSDRKQKDGGARQSGGSGVGGGGAAGARRKRWRPEELDPMIAAEDAELKRLERLLGVSGPNAKKKRAKLEKELEVEDGLGDEFGAFLSDLDRIGDAVEGGAGGSGSSDDDRALMEANWDFHKNVSDDDNSVTETTADRADTTPATEEGEDEENDADDDEDDLAFGEGGLELLDGVVDSDEDLLETIQEEEEEEEEEEAEGEEMDGGEGKREHGQSEEDDEEGFGNQETEDEYEDDSVEQQAREQGLQGSISLADTAGFGDEYDEDAVAARGKGRAPVDATEEDGGETEESEDFKRHTYKPKPGQDIYGRTIGTAKGGTAPMAYVPPHLRAAAGAANGSVGTLDKSGGSVKRAEVQRVVNGIMNRLSEETLEPVTARLREAYRGHSTTEANEALWQATKAVCVHDKHVMMTLIPSFTAVIAALNISLGADVGGFFLETIARELKDEVWGTADERSDASANDVKSVSVGARGRGRGTGSNLLLLLAYLYNYGVAHCTLVYDIIGLLVDGFSADEMELLLLLLRHSGYQLRSDDPHALKQIVALVKDKSATPAADDASAISPTKGTHGSSASSITEETSRWKAAFGGNAGSSQNGGYGNGDGTTLEGTNTAVGGSRARYILDTILELQSNKRSRIQEQGQELGRRVRKWLGSVKAAKGGGGGAGGSDASLRVTWAELVSTESKGRWWRVGAAWAGRERSSAAAASRKVNGVGGDAVAEGGSGGGRIGGGGGGSSGGAGGENESEVVGLFTLAARQRMNTDVRRSVFVAMVGSSDCEDALEKILKLNLKGAQEREIARVIMECCSQEVSYNPFYAHLAERVCDRQPKLRFTFQVAFWDALKTLDDGAARRAGSLARLMAHLVIRKQLSLTVLKTVEIPELSPSGLLLMRVFFHEIIAAGDDAAFMELFRRLARPSGAKEGGGHSAARDNALVFLRGHLGPAPSNWDRDRRKAFRKRVKGACRLIEAIVTADELG